MTDNTEQTTAEQFAAWAQNRMDAQGCQCTSLNTAIGYALQGEPVPPCDHHDRPPDSSDPLHQHLRRKDHQS